MKYNSDIIKDLIRLGANLKISEGYSTEMLKEFVRLAKNNGVHLTVYAGTINADILKDLVRIGKGNITIEL